MSELAVVKRLEIEILGPESPFVIARTERRKEWAPIIAAAKDHKITDAASKETAVGYGRLLQASEKELSKLFTDTKQSIDAVKKPILAAEKEDLGAIKTAKDALSSIVLAYNREQDRLHQIAVREAQEAARKAAEEQRIADAIAAEQAGEKEEAEHILNEKPMLPPAVIVQKAPGKSAGEVGRVTWSAQVTNLMDLVKAVAAGTVPIQAVQANQPFLNTQATQFNLGLNYPGVEVKEKEGLHFRS